MKRIIIFVLLLVSSVSAQVPKHRFDSPKSDTAASRPIKPSAWDDYLVPRPDTCIQNYDDFTSGTTSTGNIGMLGWSTTVISSATFNIIAGIANHPGLCSLGTGISTSGTGGTISMYLSPSPVIGTIRETEFFDVTFKVRLNEGNNPGGTDSAEVRFGVANTAADTGTASPGDGVYFETLQGETQWFGVVRNTSETRTAALATTDANFHSFRLRTLDFNADQAIDSVGFSIDNGTEIRLVNTNQPNVRISPFLRIGNGDRPTHHGLVVDYYQEVITVSR